ncbi:hypothetical protein [Pseudaminobacter sp. NGMCC 1.201702]
MKQAAGVSIGRVFTAGKGFAGCEMVVELSALFAAIEGGTIRQ